MSDPRINSSPRYRRDFAQDSITGTVSLSRRKEGVFHHPVISSIEWLNILFLFGSANNGPNQRLFRAVLSTISKILFRFFTVYAPLYSRINFQANCSLSILCCNCSERNLMQDMLPNNASIIFVTPLPA